jgi:NADH:ubiquinone oxidoreductase subunit C
MEKIEVTIDNLKDKLKEFYKPKQWHFLTLNGVALDEKSIELQWIFSKYYEIDNIVMFYLIVDCNQVIPSVVDIIPSAIISQREAVDMFGIEIEDSPKGLYLDKDSKQMPLSGCRL